MCVQVGWCVARLGIPRVDTAGQCAHWKAVTILRTQDVQDISLANVYLALAAALERDPMSAADPPGRPGPSDLASDPKLATSRVRSGSLAIAGGRSTPGVEAGAKGGNTMLDMTHLNVFDQEQAAMDAKNAYSTR